MSLHIAAPEQVWLETLLAKKKVISLLVWIQEPLFFFFLFRILTFFCPCWLRCPLHDKHTGIRCSRSIIVR